MRHGCSVSKKDLARLKLPSKDSLIRSSSLYLNDSLINPYIEMIKNDTKFKDVLVLTTIFQGAEATNYNGKN